MSRVAWAKAVVLKLQAVLELDDSAVDLMADGKPKPSAGEWFYAVHPGEWKTDPNNSDFLNEAVGINITITRRVGSVPPDRWGVIAWADDDTGMEAKARLVLAAIHQQYDVLNQANAYLPAGQVPYVEPLLFENGTVPQEKDAKWFGAVAPKMATKTVYDTAPAGLAMVLTFGKARRTQETEDPMG